MNFRINKGERVGIVGSSGCGKSSIVKLLLRFHDPVQGTIKIGGEDLKNFSLDQIRNEISVVHQDTFLFHGTIEENIQMGSQEASEHKIREAAIDAKIHEFIKTLPDGYKTIIGAKGIKLSGGQRQRVAVGRAIVRNPKVVLFDEPLSNLDAKLRVTMRAEISSLHSRLQATMIYVTHDQIEAMTMGDRIVVMRDGLIQQIGSQLGLYNQPVYRFVAGFIGSPPMNIMNAKIAEKDGNLLVDEGNFQIRLSDEESAELSSYVGKDVLLGIRPEDLEWSQESGGENNIIATVEVVEPLGAEIHLYVSTENNQLIARVPPRLDFEVGQKVNLIADVSKVHIFDAESEVSILQPKVTTASE